MSNASINTLTVTLGTQLGTALNFLAAARQDPPLMSGVIDRWSAVQQQMFEPYGFTSKHVGAAPKNAACLPEFMRHAVPLLRGVFDQHLLSICVGDMPPEVAEEQEVTPDLLLEAREAGLVSAYVSQVFISGNIRKRGAEIREGASQSEIITWSGRLIAAGGMGMSLAGLVSQQVEPIRIIVGVALVLGGVVLASRGVVDKLRA